MTAMHLEGPVGLFSEWRRVARSARVACAACVLAWLASTASGEDFVEGVHYEKLPIAVAPAEAGTIEVVEVFSYGCIHCYRFDPAMEQWRAVEREGVAFRRLPAVFGSSWEPLARWYYAADVLGVHSEVHTPLFEAIHEHRLDIREPSLAAQLFENVAGVAPAEFEKAAGSFSVGYRIQQDTSSLRKFRIDSVPTMVVAGKYRITGEMAGSNVRMLEVVDFLIARERADEAGNEAGD